LHHAPGGTQAFVGGISRNFDSNLVLDPQADRLVVEADEFDRSFLTLAPAAAILTSMDSDHLDIYHTPEELQASYRHFLQGTAPEALLCAHESLRPQLESVDWGTRRLVFYGFTPRAEVRIERLRIDPLASTFDLVLHTGTVLTDLRLPLPGAHNVLNCAAAVTLACAEGLSPHEVPDILARYQGVKRRFEVLHNTAFALYVDDYAHHPEELRATFQAVRSARPGWPLVVAFQPHLYTRTRDFWQGFAEVLSTPEVCLLLNIYPAREQPIESIHSELLIKDVKAARKSVLNLEQTANQMTAFTSEPTIFLTVGAGDIDTQVPEVLKAVQAWEARIAAGSQTLDQR
jgi:UDP-N-acetylmuramate--alanine ligase